MERIWSAEYFLRANDFDKYGHIRPAAVLELFQDAAGRHAEALGLGFEAMLERSYLWVLTRIRFEIVAPPQKHQRLTVKTWPLAPNRLSYRREYAIEDETGNPLVLGSSEWVIIHAEKRRFLSVGDLYPFTDGFCEEFHFEPRLAKVPDFAVEGEGSPVAVGFCDLDENGHVNNTKYANFVLNATPPRAEETLVRFQIDYRKEVLEDTRVLLHHTRLSDGILAKGTDQDGAILFACKLEYQ